MADFVTPVGPVDVAVVGFPEQAPDARVTAALSEAVASGAVRVLDVLVVKKADDGAVTIVDVDSVEESLELLGFPADLPGLLGEDDATGVAAELPEGTSAVIIAWENTWAVRLRTALADAGGVVALHQRIEPAEIAVAVEAFAMVDGR